MAGRKRQAKRVSLNRKEGLLKKILEKAIELHGNQIAISDIHKLAFSMFPQDYSKEELDEEIQRYIALGYLTKIDNNIFVTHKFVEIISRDKSKQLTLERFFNLLGAGVSTFDEILEKLEKYDELSIPQLYKLIQNYGIEVSDVLVRVALETDFFERNPRDLLMEFLKDCTNEHNELAEIYRSTSAEGKRRALERSIKRLRKIIHSVFQRYLGIPVGISRYCPIRIPSRFEDPIEVNYETVERWLSKRIVDDKVVIPIRTKRGRSFAGIDASSLKIKPPLRKRFPEIRVFTSVSVIYRPDGSSVPEVKPKPERIASENLSSLEREGFVVRGSDILSYSDYYIDRIAEALMQKRIYSAAEEMYTRSDRPDAIYLDGRTWPTEHKVSDFFAEHKDYVRSMLIEYQKLASTVRLFGTPVMGVVKRGHLGFLWYLVFWYAYKNGIVSREHFILEPYIYESLENKDGAVALWLLILYYYKTRRFGRLFSVWRKLYAADLGETGDVFFGLVELTGKDPIEAEDDYTFWHQVAEEIVARRVAGSKIDDIEGLLSGKNVLTHRIPPDILDKINALEKEEKKRLADELASCPLYSHKMTILREKLDCELISVDDESFISTLADIYAFGDVATFYFLPPLRYAPEWIEMFADTSEFDPGSHPIVSLPRFDLLIPVRDVLLAGKTIEEKKKLISELVDRSVFGTPEEELYVWYDSGEGTKWNLIVPAAVYLAHKFCKSVNKEEIAKQYVGLVLATLYALIREKGGGVV